jgi:hypothetical protein
MTGIQIDPDSGRRFLMTAFDPSDWVAIFLKSYQSGRVAQRVGSLRWALCLSTLGWLREMNERGFNIYVSVNAIAARRRRRTRDAIASVRHVFLDADHDGDAILSAVQGRTDLHDPSYVLHSSPARLHLFWRAVGFDGLYVEQLQKQLARELGTDPAATPITQTTRLPGFVNHKYSQPHLVQIEYRDSQRRLDPDDFPALRPAPSREIGRIQIGTPATAAPVVERARRYLARIPPAVAGHHGDLHTFRVCCRLARGFALDEERRSESCRSGTSGVSLLGPRPSWSTSCDGPHDTAASRWAVCCSVGHSDLPVRFF